MFDARQDILVCLSINKSATTPEVNEMQGTKLAWRKAKVNLSSKVINIFPSPLPASFFPFPSLNIASSRPPSPSAASPSAHCVQRCNAPPLHRLKYPSCFSFVHSTIGRIDVESTCSIRACSLLERYCDTCFPPCLLKKKKKLVSVISAPDLLLLL